MQNTLSILSGTTEVTRISNEAKHTSLFHMLKMPYFPNSIACTRNITHAKLLLVLHCTLFQKKKLIYRNRLVYSQECFYSILLSFILVQTWVENNVHLHSAFSPGAVGTLYVLAPGEYFLKASGKLSLRFRHSFYIEELVPLLEQFKCCSIRCVFRLLPCSS